MLFLFSVLAHLTVAKDTKTGSYQSV